MVDRNKRFVYGTFFWPFKNKGLQPPPRPSFVLPGTARLNAWDQIALEVIREYGANELIGKMHYKGAFNQWVPVQISDLDDVDWYKFYKASSPLMRKSLKHFHFEMEGSGPWLVLHFRTETDESGPYVAAALRYPTEE